MHNNHFEYGIYVALVKCTTTNFTFNCCFEYGYNNVDEYIYIFKGKTNGVYFGEYEIIGVNQLEKISW